MSTRFSYRPRTHRGHGYQATYDLKGAVGDTTYQQEYDRKLQAWQDPHDRVVHRPAKPDPIRAGTASGNRRNNPHPLKVSELCYLQIFNPIHHCKKIKLKKKNKKVEISNEILLCPLPLTGRKLKGLRVRN